MTRELSLKCPGTPNNAYGSSNKWEHRIYKISLVTPLFGGGTTPGKNDPVSLIRVPSIRGSLRFWWRATRGARFESIQDLRKKEGEIWGTASYPSSVIMKVDKLVDHASKDWKELRNNINLPAKGVLDFIVREKMKRNKPVKLITDVAFNLEISWRGNSSLKDDVEAAVWAWVNFGGLGARTRRGCGALYCCDFSPTFKDALSLKSWYKKRLEQYSIKLPQDIRPWPVLPSPEKLLVNMKNGKTNIVSPLVAWAKPVGVLESFRQGPGTGRHIKKNGRAGRSLWPEADSLRRITKQGAPRHRKSVTGNRNAFPRAEFGLPIVFHFKDGPGKNKWRPGNDPDDCQLLPSESERMASPLILKPLAVKSHKAVSIILPLHTRLPTAVIAEYTNMKGEKIKSPPFDVSHIRGACLTSYSGSLLRRYSTTGSALEAFLIYAGREGFK